MDVALFRPDLLGVEGGLGVLGVIAAYCDQMLSADDPDLYRALRLGGVSVDDERAELAIDLDLWHPGIPAKPSSGAGSFGAGLRTAGQ